MNIQVDGREFRLAFFSHSWETHSVDMAKAKPESSIPGHKAAALAARSRAHPETDYYYFIDYASMEQENLAALVESVCMLPLHIACCDEMVMYDSPTCAYERRAWTRIERMLAFCLLTRPKFYYVGSNPVEMLVAENSEVFEFGSDQGSVEMRISDPTDEEEAGIEEDPGGEARGLVTMLAETAVAWPLNPAVAGGGQTRSGVLHRRAVLSQITVPVDTTHVVVALER